MNVVVNISHRSRTFMDMNVEGFTANFMFHYARFGIFQIKNFGRPRPVGGERCGNKNHR